MSRKSIFEREINPLIQAGIVVSCILLFTAAGSLFQRMGVIAKDPFLSWSITATLLLFYAIFNSILSLSYRNQNQYWVLSIAGFVIIGGLGILFSTWVSGVTLGDAKSFKFLFKLFGFGYLIILTIVRAMRKIVRIAQKQDKRLRGEE